MSEFSALASFIWSNANLLRGDYKQSEYGRVILPFTVLRRFDAVLEPTKAAVLAASEKAKTKFPNLPHDDFLKRASGLTFYNASRYDFSRLLDDPEHIKANLVDYVQGFSVDALDIFEKFNFFAHLERLDEANLLYLIVQKFSEIDLHPSTVTNYTMGLVFEELIRRFAESSNETAGEHFTPRDVIRLMVDLLFLHDENAIQQSRAPIRAVYDPAAGTGGMLSVAEESLRGMNPRASLQPFGQELNPESFAIFKSDMLIKGHPIDRLYFDNTFTHDGTPRGMTFDYMLSNPPYGVEWKKVEAFVRKEAEERGFEGRFGAGLPRISDGSLLFLQHLISKMRPADEGGSRIAIIFNGSPLFTGGAGSGESEIRRWIIENDWLEGLVALPTDLFYNTGIATYIWLVTNRKSPDRRGKIQLINAVDFWQKMRKSLGSKRRELSDEHIATISRAYGEFEPSPICKIFDNVDFGYTTITVERPLRLRFQATPERIAQLQEPANKKKFPGDQDVIAAIESIDTQRVFMKKAAFFDAITDALHDDQIKVRFSAAQEKLLIQIFAEPDENAEIMTDTRSRIQPDANLRDTENVPLKDDIEDYFTREVMPHVDDAWIDYEKSKVGYEIPFNRHFYVYTPPRPLHEIDADLLAVTEEIERLLRVVTE